MSKWSCANTVNHFLKPTYFSFPPGLGFLLPINNCYRQHKTYQFSKRITRTLTFPQFLDRLMGFEKSCELLIVYLCEPLCHSASVVVKPPVTLSQ